MKKNAGSTMLIILSVLATLSACVIAALNYTAVVSRDVMRSNTMRSATSVGDGALDYAFVHWRSICRQQTNTQRPTADFANIPLPAQALFPSIQNFTANGGANPNTGAPYTIANFKVTAVDPQLNPLATDTTAPEAGTGMNLGTSSYFYLASADVTLPAFAGRPVSVKLRRVFEKQLQSPWNYAIFYTEDLEIHPGPIFNVAGWVHTNGKLYTAHDTLNFQNKVTYADDWSVGFHPGDKTHNSETAKSPNYPSDLPPARGQAQQPFGMDSTELFDTSDPNANSESYRELIEPPSAGPDPFESARYYNQADVRILVDAGNNVKIRNSADAIINSSSTGNDLILFNVVKSAVKTNDKLQDNREGAEMRIVTLDMDIITKALTPAAQGGTGELVNKGFQGIVYVSDTSGTSTVKRGVRLKNGAKMPTGGMTVASNNPVYIQGDYNTGRTVNGSGAVTKETPANSNNNGTGSNVVSGYTKQPCAVLGDAVMVLSNAWTDANSYNSVNSRQASPTTVNTAIVSGIVASGGVSSGSNSYSGGAENFPRFLEKWGNNKTFTYYGSMVQLFKSNQNIGFWGSANVYNPPRREWNFDTLFYTNPPPGTLTLISYNKQRWFVQ